MWEFSEETKILNQACLRDLSKKSFTMKIELIVTLRRATNDAHGRSSCKQWTRNAAPGWEHPQQSARSVHQQFFQHDQHKRASGIQKSHGAQHRGRNPGPPNRIPAESKPYSISTSHHHVNNFLPEIILSQKNQNLSLSQVPNFLTKTLIGMRACPKLEAYKKRAQQACAQRFL